MIDLAGKHFIKIYFMLENPNFQSWNIGENISEVKSNRMKKSIIICNQLAIIWF